MSSPGLLWLCCTPACAAGLDPQQLTLWWGLPFAGVLLSIAAVPLIAPDFWHHHFGKIAGLWALGLLLPFALRFGLTETTHQIAHALLLEYLPFMVLLFALYTIAGGIHVAADLRASPRTNLALLGIGTALASVMGTTGAAMLMIRPVIRANATRRYQTHVVVFFIFLVANVGGALTPLGDPPLFLGFLQGVHFFWTTQYLLLPTLMVSALLFALFFAVDTYFMRRETPTEPSGYALDGKVRIDGKINFLLLAASVAAVLMSGLWNPGRSLSLLGTPLEWQNLLRDGLLMLLALASLALTPAPVRRDNEFNWFPMQEVAKLFACIFLTIFPVIAILRAGDQGALGDVVRLVTDSRGQPVPALYFWCAGLLSAFLDNAPTYLVFFNMAGGDPAHLMGAGAKLLEAISAGAVFMGALTYIGNAPNFMVRAVAVHQGVRMPGFFAYMGWSLACLMPCFLLVSWVFFR
ncbi:sodium:proton antiporter [Undibacterium arcticum]|uniref:Sodium:proton antiporter n=1 Tax=Undibacterium arcticum TaxID=1762892 RepID=A0ABV7EYC6_9BURK